MRGMDFVEAMKYLAEKYGIEWVEGERQYDSKNQEKESLHLLVDDAKEYYVSLLAKNEEARAYLSRRHLSESVLKDFAIGYSDGSRKGCMNHLLNKGYSFEALQKVGLVIGDKVASAVDFFRDKRIIFPISNAIGKGVAFGARTLGRAEPKYLNSNDNEVYSKSETLYGFFQAKQAMRKEGHLYLVEGYTDVLAMVNLGVEAVAGICGTSLTPAQVKLINRRVKQVTLLLDHDEAGIHATLRSIPLLLAGGVDVDVVLVPEGEDPASFGNRVGKEALHTYLKKEATDFITFMIRKGFKNSNPSNRTKVIHDIVTNIATIPDTIKQAVYLNLCSEKSGIEVTTLKGQLETILKKKRRRTEWQQLSPKKEATITSDKKQDEQEERVILTLLLRYGHVEVQEGVTLADYVFNIEEKGFNQEGGEVQGFAFFSKAYGTLYAFLKEKKEALVGKNLLQQLSDGDEERKQAIIALLSTPIELSPEWHKREHLKSTEEKVFATIREVLLKKQFQIIRKEVATRSQALRDSENNEEEEKRMQIYQWFKEREKKVAQALGIVVYPEG